MAIKCLCMDFDGVFVDSTNECVKVALSAYKNIISEREFKTHEIEDLKILRPKVKGAKEYLFAINLLLNSKDNIKHSDFELRYFQNIYDKHTINLYIEEFYKEREKLINNNINEWIKSHKFYEDAFEIVKSLIQNQVEFAIISLKDKKSIDIFLNSKGYRNIKIFDNSVISNKPEGLYKIFNENNIKKEDIIFIDDNPVHIQSCLEEGFENSYMPSWNKICLNYSKLFLILN